MDSLWLRCVLLTIAACGPDVEGADDGAGTSGEQGSSTGAGPTSTAEPGTDETTGDDGATGSSEATTGPATATTVDPETGSSAGSGDVDQPFEPVCSDDRDFEVTVSGTNQGAHDGRFVWVSAVEPDLETNEHPIVVHLRATIENGAFELSCPAGLTETFEYPSLAVVLDADDDGTCSEGDLAFMTQLFGWDRAQRYAFDGDAVYGFEGDRPILLGESAWQPVEGMVGFSGAPFCEYLFP